MTAGLHSMGIEEFGTEVGKAIVRPGVKVWQNITIIIITITYASCVLHGLVLLSSCESFDFDLSH